MIQKKKLNILFISIAFPPKNDPECLQTAKYFKYMVKDKNVDIDVVTSVENTLYMEIDEHLSQYAEGYRQKIEVPFFENKYINYLYRSIRPDGLKYPDSRFRFVTGWKNVVESLKKSPDIIYSRSFPLSSALMALNLQKHYKVPWILHLSDPWSLTPLYELGKARAWNEAKERECFERATYITFSSMKTLEIYRKHYPEFQNKLLFYPNVFDPEDRQETVYTHGEKLRVLYTGGLIGNRSPEPLLEAIHSMKKQFPEIIKDFEFVFAGALDRKNRKFFEHESQLVKHLGLLPFSDALKLQRQADILLVIDTPFKNSEDAQFFPSKLLDYMLIKRRILAVTDKESVTWGVVHEKLGSCHEHTDTKGIVKALRDAWKAWKEKNTSYFVNASLDKTYAADYNAIKLINLMKSIVHEV